MKITLSLFATCLLLLSCQVINSQVKLTAGISQELAELRKEQVDNVSYKLSFDIPLEKSTDIPATLALNFTLQTLKAPLFLDFNEKKENVKGISVNGKAITIVHEKEHIIIGKELLKLGENNIDINFIAGNSSLNRNEDFLYTLLVPDRASTLFPCFDQPDIKAKYTLSLKVPNKWTVLAAAKIANQTQAGEFTTYEFEQSDLMSTYLFSFVAGEFKDVTEFSMNFPMKMLYRENNEEKLKESTATIFGLHQQAISFLEKYTDYPFPFKKMDFASIPVFQYGGMEHVGAIQYKEASLFLDNSATDSDKLTRGKLIAHETSHMWFGDLVTMKWFDDVWMKEVFANFMADKIMNPAFPETNHNLQFLTGHYPAAYSEDRTQGTHPIKQELANLKNAGSLYGGIIYHKAPIMMRQLEAMMGKESFQKGIQKYIAKFANSNASWLDLVTILDDETTLDLKKWSEVWVNESERAIFSDEIEYNAENRITKFQLHQEAEDGSSKVWPQVFEIALVYADTTKVYKVNVEGKTSNLANLLGLEKPLAILYNYDGYGYGVFPVDLKTVTSSLRYEDDVARASNMLNIYENTLAGKVEVETSYHCFLNALQEEKNELVAKLIADQLKSLYWYYLTKEQQNQFHEKTINSVYNRMQEDIPANVKKTLFNLYQGLAYTASAKETLYQIWNKKVVIPNLKFNEDDYTGMATNLLIYKHPNEAEIIAATKLSIKNPDKLKRFIYLLPSLSNDSSVRKSFMESLRNKDNREKESWVQSALLNIHHPLRQDASYSYLKQCLEMTEEIQLTGDIFFPKAWLNNSIGLYSSAKALGVLEQFLKDNPKFSPILKRKLLQATDNLYRSQQIKMQVK
ncbi:M1 family aminopeptidase [Flavobacterium frigidarium]|uniref:M1 family metallopeptidase n=1 Tax=Flavobacterium frigidarium TaxID=99286 RepID=UPI0030D8B82E|tara:strand:+ start:1318 stop:3885 length:2568 start_codon:yes stop_codon:yes gene_type:complete